MQYVGYAALLWATFRRLKVNYTVQSCINTSLNDRYVARYTDWAHSCSDLKTPLITLQCRKNTCVAKLWACRKFIFSQVCDMVILPLWSAGSMFKMICSNSKRENTGSSDSQLEVSTLLFCSVCLLHCVFTPLLLNTDTLWLHLIENMSDKKPVEVSYAVILQSEQPIIGLSHRQVSDQLQQLLTDGPVLLCHGPEGEE